ncbi:hypothetical protein CJ195_18865 [Bacillus sp. UMB0899]|uniref:hypothetical protein n=1 Tax=Metabacillus schmidteae TaxID=2730405 RepID=UPI000C7FF961|nr:hypothetical protein [Metabacillus schmidteae]PMC35471.1 hypothetical protein CJ195_18865 [Bacillus sp. UMB0899]
MDKQMLSIMFEEKEEKFTGEEVAVFKRYIEENVAYSENIFEFLEENLSYYSARYTSEHYFSPSEYFHVNSNPVSSDEFLKNMDLYEKSIEWHSSTVHPQDSEYVMRKEKYVDLGDFPLTIKELIAHLNEYSKQGYFMIDLLILVHNEIYQYLPQKDFLFKWKNTSQIKEKLKQHQYFSFRSLSKEIVEDENSIILLPIFTPIRKMLFLGEYGYKNGLIQYGRILERISQHLEKTGQPFEHIEYLDTSKVNEILHLDGVERSIMEVFITKS